MEIGGYDYRFPISVGNVYAFWLRIFGILGEYWPEYVVEWDFEEREVFVYRDRLGKESWDDDVGPPGTMLYFIMKEGEMTIVHDEEDRWLAEVIGKEVGS